MCNSSTPDLDPVHEYYLARRPIDGKYAIFHEETGSRVAGWDHSRHFVESAFQEEIGSTYEDRTYLYNDC